jgi:glycosyltransferase involved in cell wall biosynthesis
MLNEAPNVRPLLDEIIEVMDGLEKPYEVIAVDDGSTDTTFKELVGYDHSPLRVLRFRRRFGQTAALSAGFDHASGAIIITLDADLQNDPRDIPRLLQSLDEGADIVSGWRKDRKDIFLTRRVPSMLANSLISKVTGVKLHDYGCALKAYRAEIIRETRLYGELHRFVPALASVTGAKLVEIVVNHRERQHGHSKYGLGRTSRVILDLMTVKFLLSYGRGPIHIFGPAGFWSLFIGTGVLGYLGFLRLVQQQAIANRPLLTAAMLLVLGGLQFISIGLISELLVRIYHESSGKRIYSVGDRVNFEEPPAADPIWRPSTGKIQAG